MGRGLIVNVFMLSFLGCLLFVITGENDPLPSRNDGTSEEISFGDETIDMIYDYYSVVCEMSDTGIFAALNAIKDSEDKPYYFYICDLMLQGGIDDEVLGISETFYLGEELGAYVGFCKDAISLVIQYAGTDTNVLLSGDQEAMLEVMTNIIKDEAFVADFSELIDDFEKQPYIINLALCALTSMVNHIELIFGEDNVVTRLVKNVFNEETGLKITDLATEQDIKHLFKAVVNIASTALKDMEENQINLDEGYFVTSVFAMLQNVKAGDDFVLLNPYTLEEFSVKIKGIINNDMQNAIFCNKKNVLYNKMKYDYFSKK